MTRPVRIGQFAAFYGDRARLGLEELLASEVDFLTGDYLAELTMLILHKNELRGRGGYATGFVDDVTRYLGAIADRGVKVVTNAGGLDPAGCAAALESCIRELGLDLTVATVHGDDVTPTWAALRSAGETFTNTDTGSPLPDAVDVVVANAYLGAWPIVEALELGADIVVCPRVTDAALVIAPAAYWHGWSSDAWDELAGALVAGHIIECGAQATGGNYAYFAEHEPLGIPGMPIASVAGDGTSVISKANASGGVVNADTVTAQCLYEVGGPMYHNPDVVVDLGTIELEDLGEDRVAVRGSRGFPPTDRTKVSLCFAGGYRNTMTIGLTGLNFEQKAAWIRQQMAEYIRPESEYEAFTVSYVGAAAPADPASFEQATRWMVISVRDPDRDKVGRQGFANKIVQLGVSSIPGLYTTTPPQPERSVSIQWPCLVSKSHVQSSVRMGGREVEVPWGPTDADLDHEVVASQAEPPPTAPDVVPTVPAALGEICATRSGDKAGTANLGVWGRSPEAYRWLAAHLTVARLQQLLPETAGLHIERHLLPNLRAINFVIVGFLGMGVSSCLSIDPQAKGLGEYLRSKVVPVPESVLASVVAEVGSGARRHG